MEVGLTEEDEKRLASVAMRFEAGSNQAAIDGRWLIGLVRDLLLKNTTLQAENERLSLDAGRSVEDIERIELAKSKSAFLGACLERRR